jgi:hypothetical protein
MAVSLTICAGPVRPLLMSGLVAATTVSSSSVTICCLSSKSCTYFCPSVSMMPILLAAWNPIERTSTV